MFLKLLSFLLTILCVFLSFSSNIYAQDTDSLDNSNDENNIQLNNVQEILRRYEVAEHFYAQGKLDSVAKILLPYLKDRRLLRKVDKSTRAEIYRLAAMNYILADSLTEAERNIKNVLNQRHNYQIRQGDLLSFKAALDTMYISPRFTVGVRAGWVGSVITQVKDYSVAYGNNNLFKESYAFNATGLSFGLSTSYYLTRRFALVVEPNFTTSGYTYEVSLDNLNNQANAGYSYKMNFTSLAVPVMVKYHLLRRPLFSPYILFGFSYNYLFNATKIASSLSLDYTPIMQQHNYGGIVGAGFSKSIGKRATFSIDARYINNFVLLNKSDKRFLNNDKGNIDTFLYSIYDAIDDLRMQNLQVNLTVSYYLTYKVF
jgi:hypothetical protein